MVNQRFAVIDIGSNTFHLIIVDSQKSGAFEIINRHREFVYLAKDGIQFLSSDTIDRGFMAFARIAELCQKYKVEQIKAVGSAALRSASNATDFVDLIHKEYDIQIDVISGLREAQLIYQGVALSGVQMENPSLIVDIGGGSVECIIVINGSITFFNSYNIGISELRHRFPHQDPISQHEIVLICDHLDSFLEEFLNKAVKAGISTLIGSSGPFEIIESIAQVKSHESISREKIQVIAQKILSEPLSGRLAMSRMPDGRADLSVESLLIIYYLLDRIQSINCALVSPYALKEGVISEMI